MVTEKSYSSAAKNWLQNKEGSVSSYKLFVRIA